MIAVGLGFCLYAPLLLLLLLAAAQDPPHSYSWYSGDIAGEMDRARAAGVPMDLGKMKYLASALRINSERWSYIETQVMENLDIDLDMDLVQEPLQNLALAQLLLADLAFQMGSEEATGFQAMERGCSVQVLVQPDQTTPHPYSQGSLSKRCSALLEKICPKNHPSMNGNEAVCRSTHESIVSNRQLRQSLVDSKSKRAVNLTPEGSENQANSNQYSGLSSPTLPISDTSSTVSGTGASPKGVTAGGPIDRREYSEIASTLYNSDLLMRLYTPEAPSDNPLAPAVVAPSQASMTALYLCLFISLSVTALLVNKRKQYSRRGGKPHHSLLTARGLKELIGQVPEIAAGAATELHVFSVAMRTNCASAIQDFLSQAKAWVTSNQQQARPHKSTKDANPGKSGSSKKQNNGSSDMANIKNGLNGKYAPPSVRPNTVLSSKSTITKSKTTLRKLASLEVSSISGQTQIVDIARNTTTIALKEPDFNPPGIISQKSSTLTLESDLDNRGAAASICGRTEAVFVETALSSARKDINQAEVAHVEEEMLAEESKDDINDDFDDNSSLSSLTMGPEMGGRDTPSPVIPFIADYEDELRKANAMNNMKSPQRSCDDPEMTWTGDFKLFSPTAGSKPTSIATFGHPTIGIIPPSEDNVPLSKSFSPSSWMGIDGQVHSDTPSNLNEAAQSSALRSGQDLHLYNYWGGGSAVSVNSAESSIYPKSFQSGLKAMVADFSSVDVALNDSSLSLPDRSFTFSGAVSRPPVSPQRRNPSIASPLLSLDVSFMEQSVTAGNSAGPSTGNSRGVSTGTSGILDTFSDDADCRNHNFGLGSLHESVDASSAFPIAPTLFGSSKPPLHRSNSASEGAGRAPPPGFEDVTPDPPRFSKIPGSIINKNINMPFGDCRSAEAGGEIHTGTNFSRGHSGSGAKLRPDAPPFQRHISNIGVPASPPDATKDARSSSETIVLQVIGL